MPRLPALWRSNYASVEPLADKVMEVMEDHNYTNTRIVMNVEQTDLSSRRYEGSCTFAWRTTG